MITQQSEDPFDTLDRGTVILPVAYAMLADSTATLQAIAHHDSVALTQLIQRHEGVAHTRATQQRIFADAQQLIDQLPFVALRERLFALLQPFSTPN